MNFLKSKSGIALAVVVLLTLGAVSAWRIKSRADQRGAKKMQQRIERDVKQSINNATKVIKLCPLSNPDCGKR